MKRIVAFLMLICFMSVSVGNVAKADGSKLVARYTGYVNGVERILKITTDGTYNYLYVKSGEEDFQKNGIFLQEDEIFVGKKNAIVWSLDKELEILMYWTKEISAPGIFSGYKHDVKRIITEGEKEETVAVGYETEDGRIYPLPGFYDLLNVDKSMPEPIYVPAYISEDSTENPAEISVKKSKSKASIYQGNQLIGKITLKKGTLTWTRKNKKKQVYKNVKRFTFIEKSKNFVYETKKGAVTIVSIKTAKKQVVKKDGEIVIVNGYATKIKTGSKKIDITNL